MGIRVSISEVNSFLIKIKQAISRGKYQFAERKKNIASLASVGLLPGHAKELILQLTYLDYLSGPEDEIDPRFPPGEVMFFGKEITEKEFFIKIKLLYQEDFCVCISFHIAERQNHYAYRTID